MIKNHKKKLKNKLENKCFNCQIKNKCEMSKCYKKFCNGPFKNKKEFLSSALKIVKNISIYEKCAKEKI